MTLARAVALVLLAGTGLCGVARPVPAQATNPFIGEIENFAFNFCPKGWAKLNGALLPISENDVLFQLIGTTYGGDGITTFALPTAKPNFPTTCVPLTQGIPAL